MNSDAAAAIIMAIAAVVLFIGASWFNASRCEAQSRSFEAHEWGPVQDCMVLIDGRWLPLKNIRGFDD